jgi:hypothetical protein
MRRRQRASQLGRVLQLYEQIRRKDPTYPDIAIHVMRTKEELLRGYIDNRRRVIPERLIAREERRIPCVVREEKVRMLSPLIILILLVVCILLAIGLLLLLRGGLL